MNILKLSLFVLVAAHAADSSLAFAQTAPPPVGQPVVTEQSAAKKWIIDDATPRDRPQRIDVLGSAYYFGATSHVAIGGMYLIPIVPEGFIPALNDTFSLEFGAYVDYFSYTGFGVDYNWTGITPVGGVRWDFHLTERWTVFATAKAGSTFELNRADGAPGTTFLTIDSGVGALWHITSAGSLRLQTSSHAGFAVGWSIPL